MITQTPVQHDLQRDYPVIEGLYQKKIIPDQAHQALLNKQQTLQDWVLWLIETYQINPLTLRDFFAHYFAQPILQQDPLTPQNILYPYWSHNRHTRHSPCVPIKDDGHQIMVAVSNPDHLKLLTPLAHHWQRPCVPVWSNALTLHRLGHVLNNTTTKIPQTKPIYNASQWVDELLTLAYHQQATDIHIESDNQQIKSVLLRIHGVITSIKLPTVSFATQCISRLKVLAHLDTTQQKTAQDGAFTYHIPSVHQPTDFRISCLPTGQGEKIAIRILKRCLLSQSLSFSELGMSSDMQLKLTQALKQPQGFILFTGPTGSGKTRTIYQSLRHLQQQGRLIYTLEDPVEVQLNGITQIEVSQKQSLNFSQALKALLRQDPDVIALGEIRDADTAKIAFQAAQTGHLILASLHAQSAMGALTRLYQLGIDSIDIAATLNFVLTQRLIRTLCSVCKTEHKVPDEMSQKYGWLSTMHAQGCPQCQQGFSGRTALFEALIMPEKLINQASTLLSFAHLLEKLKSYQYDGLQQCAYRKVAKGITSIDELARAFPQWITDTC